MSEPFWLSSLDKSEDSAWLAKSPEVPEILETRKYGDISIFKMKNGSVIVAFTTVASNGNSETHTFAPKDLITQCPGFGSFCVDGICMLPDGSGGDTLSVWKEDRNFTDAELIEKAKEEIRKKHRVEVAKNFDFGPQLLMARGGLVLFVEDGKYIIRKPGKENIDVSIDISDSFMGAEGQFEMARIFALIEAELIKRRTLIDCDDLVCRIEKTDVARFINKNFRSSEINALTKSLTNEKKGVQDIWNFIDASSVENRI